MVGAAVRGDDQVGLQPAQLRLDQDMHAGVCARATFGIADDLARRVTTGNGNQPLAGLEGDVGHTVRRRVETIEGPFHIRVG